MKDKWQIQTFKHKAFLFLYNQGIITQTYPVPTNQEIQKQVMIRSNKLFETPKHCSNNYMHTLMVHLKYFSSM